MTVAAVATVLNEEAIVGETIEHLFAHGISHVYVAHGPSTDNTFNVLLSFGSHITVFPDPSPIHYQPKWINQLAARANDDDHEWIIPFDADEFWCPTKANTIREAIDILDPNVNCLVAAQFHHHTLEYRNPDHNWLPKMAFRYSPTAVVSNGNHGISGLDGTVEYDVLFVRELQFLSLEHLRAKSSLRVKTINPELGEGDGAHQRVLAKMDDEELAKTWEQMAEFASMYDPIPVRKR